ncbi:MAG: N-acetyltransferase [Flavobacterium sp.]|nr:MAG: N-acetyltransferase [Flavobacterium sp.]
MTEDSFSLNETKNRFELEVDGHIAFVEYIINKENTIYLTHTEVPKALEGKGIGTKIVEKTLEYVKEKGYPLAPMCPFVAKYMRKHPEWQTLLAKGYNV